MIKFLNWIVIHLKIPFFELVPKYQVRFRLVLKCDIWELDYWPPTFSCCLNSFLLFDKQKNIYKFVQFFNFMCDWPVSLVCLWFSKIQSAFRLQIQSTTIDNFIHFSSFLHISCFVDVRAKNTLFPVSRANTLKFSIKLSFLSHVSRKKWFTIT